MSRQLIISSLFSIMQLCARAHIAPYGAGMYCRNGLSTVDNDPNNGEAVLPLYNLTYGGWFMHGQCINFPPPAGEFLTLPAGGSTTLQLAGNRAFTTYSFKGAKASTWTDGMTHNELSTGTPKPPTGKCITSPNLHTLNQADAAGTVFAIAYKSDINQVTMNDLTVFSVVPNTPWKRIAAYPVPKNMPLCPAGGCICAWGWVPDNCGQPNMYMTGFKCKVTRSSGSGAGLAVGAPKPPVWCQGNPSACTKGPKQMIVWHQLEGNTVVIPDAPGGLRQADGQIRSAGYNLKMGFSPGAQNDIFTTTARRSNSRVYGDVTEVE